MKEKIADYTPGGMDDEQAFKEAVTGTGIFAVAGRALLTYGILTRETDRK